MPLLTSTPQGRARATASWMFAGDSPPDSRTGRGRSRGSADQSKQRPLPPVAGGAAGHQLGFPYNVRRGVGVWKRLFLDEGQVVALDNPSEAVARGQYLVEGPGHCGECHTRRNFMGGLDRSQWLGGAPNPAGRGTIPNITPGSSSFASWSEADIANFLETGFTPEFDSAGGEMAEVVKSLARLPADDRAAIAAYLKAVPAIGG